MFFSASFMMVWCLAPFSCTSSQTHLLVVQGFLEPKTVSLCLMCSKDFSSVNLELCNILACFIAFREEFPSFNYEMYDKVLTAPNPLPEIFIWQHLIFALGWAETNHSLFCSVCFCRNLLHSGNSKVSISEHWLFQVDKKSLGECLK